MKHDCCALMCVDDFDKCPRYDVEHGSLKLNTVTGKHPEANVSCYPGYVQANGETTSHCLRGASGAFDWVPRLSCICESYKEMYITLCLSDGSSIRGRVCCSLHGGSRLSCRFEFSLD